MTTWGASLHEDNNSAKTSASYGDRGDTVNDWFMYLKAADGGIVSIGLKADAAVTNPASSGSVIAILKGILTNLGGTTGVPAGLKAEDSASASADLLMPMGVVRRDSPAAAAAAASDYVVLYSDDLGRLQVAENSSYATNATSTALEASRIIKASAGRLWGLTVFNSAAFAQFIQLYDSATLPANGVVPTQTISVPAGATVAFDFGSKGRRFTAGIVASNSTTGPTKTIGAADCLFDAQYE